MTRESEPTTDPALAAVPLPAAGPKGAGMSLVFELLASGLAANPIVPAFHVGDAAGRRHRQNGFVLAVDVSALARAHHPGRHPRRYRTGRHEGLTRARGRAR